MSLTNLREVIFSHTLKAKAKNILPKVYRSPNSDEGEIGCVWGAQVATSPQDVFAVANLSFSAA